MSSELRGVANTGSTLYANIINSSGQRWNTSALAFEAYSSADYANYAVTLTEQGSSGAFFGNFPSGIVTSGVYEYLVYLQSGGSPVEGDQVTGTGEVDWSGSAALDIIAGSMSGVDFATYVKRIWKRTDKDTELYDAATDAISELRRLLSVDEDEVETTTTGLITIAGQFQIPVESNLGRIIGDIVVVDDDISRPIQKISKEQFDVIYPNPLATSVATAKPEHFCIYAGNIYLGPVPDLLTYRYRINYSKGLTTISLASTSVPFTKFYREILRMGVLARLYAMVENDEQAIKYGSIWTGFIDQMRAREENNQGGAPLITVCNV